MHQLNVCGFVHSGKGAVIEYLKLSEIVLPFPGGETRFCRCPGGFHWLSEILEQKSRLSVENVDAFLDLLLGNLDEITPDSNWQYFAPEERHWCNGDAKHIKELFDPEYTSAAKEAGDALLSLVENETALSMEHTRWQLANIFRTFCSRITSAAELRSKATCLMFDNAFHPWNFGDRMFFPSLKTIVVDRDPRDQYIEIQDKYPVKFSSVGEYIYDFRGKRFSCSAPEPRLYAADGYYYIQDQYGEILYLTFEAFVRKSSVRRKVIDFISNGASKWEENIVAENEFHWDVSKKNTGIHPGRPEFQQDISVIESELGDWLFQ